MTTVPQAVQDSANYWASSVRINNYLTLVALTILYYDYALTLFTEIECFWRSANVTLISVMFVIVRYYGLLGPIPVILEYFADMSESSCRKLQVFHQAFAISNQAIIAITLVIRTYALYDRSRRILALLIVTHVGGAVACLIAVVTSRSPIDTPTVLPFTYSGCDLSLTNDQGIHLALEWSAMLWFDTTIFGLTLVKALHIRRHFPGGLLEIMFRDGTIYYGIMVVSNVSNIATFLATPSGSPIKGMDTTVTNVLSTILTSRLILNIRDPSLRRLRRNSEDESVTDMTATPSTSYMTTQPYTLTQIEAGTAWSNAED